MFVKDLTLALGLTLAAFAAPAQAQEGTLWKTVGDWDISVDATIGNGCYALASWNGGTVLRIGRNPEQNNFYFLIGNDKWTSLRDDQSYDLEIRFDSRPVWNVSATGLQFNPGETVYLHAQSTKMNFINEFQAALTMSISYNGAEIDSLKLTGSRLAWDEVENCQREQSRVAPRLEDGPLEDPFAVDGQVKNSGSKKRN
ncbi:MAG: hypothetical protein CMH12_13840 [Maritimibacter sp.]|nr:hypothetical protein [Maritimibacter sp.]